ncbi:MAG: hypothetical protein M3011_04035 [Actinomycetota bacterium]|nr:hypothetical protein [Actinomycetota bacterium]
MATRSVLFGGSRRWVQTLVGATAVAAMMTAGMAGTAQAATISVACGGSGGGSGGLIAAINLANNTAGADTIDLAAGCTYVLAVEQSPGNGLPVITSEVTIHGNGATIRRASAAAFRILEVAPGA